MAKGSRCQLDREVATPLNRRSRVTNNLELPFSSRGTGDRVARSHEITSPLGCNTTRLPSGVTQSPAAATLDVKNAGKPSCPNVRMGPHSAFFSGNGLRGFVASWQKVLCPTSGSSIQGRLGFFDRSKHGHHTSPFSNWVRAMLPTPASTRKDLLVPVATG